MSLPERLAEAEADQWRWAMSEIDRLRAENERLREAGERMEVDLRWYLKHAGRYPDDFKRADEGPPRRRDGGEVSDLTADRAIKARAVWNAMLAQQAENEALRAENERLREAGEGLERAMVNDESWGDALALWREASSGAESLENAADENGDAQAAPTAPDTIAGISRADLHRPLGEMR